MYKFGLKLWSINDNYAQEAYRLFESNVYDYIELYVIPDSYDNYINIWTKLKSDLNIPFVVHAPHFKNKMNTAKKESFLTNINLANQTIKFADNLESEIIIFHPGIAGYIEETVFQLNKINDERIVVENKPYFALCDDLICNGYSPEDIKFVMKNTGVGFCFDVGHSVCAANAQNIDPLIYLEKFVNLNPKIYHFTDGNYESIYDKHLHFGDGNFKIKEILNFIPDNSIITVETVKTFTEHLRDFEKDITYLKGL